MIRVIVDTNVLVSAMLAPSGNEALLILAISQKLIAPCLSDEIYDEYAGVLARPKFGFSSEEIAALLGLLREHGEMFCPPALSNISPDPDDDKFIACALAARADYLVTGNQRDFPQEQLAPTKVVSAGELLNVITLEL